jgi:NADH dehydrogenase (ubiquinone) Fe-S protein 4
MLRTCSRQAVPISRRLAASLARSVATESTPPVQATDASDATAGPSDVVPAVSPGVLTADTISGAPCEPIHLVALSVKLKRLAQLRRRAVRVYQPTRNTMQSGGAKGERWRIDFDILQGGGRWENPLMGWASSCAYFITMSCP